MSGEKKMPEIRFKGFSGAWEEKKFKDIVACLSGGASIAPNDYQSNGKRTIPKGAVNELGIADLSGSKYVSIDFYEKNILSKASAGDLVTSLRDLVPSAPNMGRVVKITSPKEDFLMPQGVYRIELENGNDENFVIAYSNSGIFRSIISREKNGSTQVHIRNGEFLDIEIIKPESEEQTAIGNTFQKLDNLINQHQKKHDKLSNIKKAMLEKMFPKQGETIPEIRFKGFSGDWQEVQLGSIAKIKGRLGWKSLKQGEYVSSGPAMIAGKHIKNGSIDWGKVDHIPLWRYLESPEIMLRNDDVIFSKDGSLGNPSVVTNLKWEATINSTMMMARPSDKLKAQFFYQVLNTKNFKDLIKEKVSGSSIPHLFQADMKLFTFHIPAPEEQIKIGNYLQNLDALINQHQQKITKLNNIKQACLRKMFV